MNEYTHWCGNCQIRIYFQRHYGKDINWQDCPYTCEYGVQMRCSTKDSRHEGVGMRDYTKLINALRFCVSDEECDECPYSGRGSCNFLQAMKDAADAIEELQKVNRERTELYEDTVKQIPKHGEWIKGRHAVECSVCSHKFYFGEETWVEDYNICKDMDWKHCPWCGVKMEVQDG